MKDEYISFLCKLSTVDDYIDILNRIVTFDPKEDSKLRNDGKNSVVDFSVQRSDKNRKYYFCVPISKQALLDMNLNPNLSFMDIALLAIEAFDIESRKRISMYFYIEIAREILFHDNSIKDDKKYFGYLFSVSTTISLYR